MVGRPLDNGRTAAGDLDGPGSDADRLDRRRFILGAAGVGLTLIGVGTACGGSGTSASGGLGGSGSGGRGGGGNRKKIAFAQPDTSFAGYPLLLAGAEGEAKRRGYTVLQSHANHQLDRQLNELNAWIGQKIGGIIVLPLDNAAMGPVIQRARAAKVKFLDYSDKALPGVDGWVIFNNLQGAQLVGKYAGDWVNKTLGGRAKVALLTHEVQQTGRDRIHGAVDALKGVAPNVDVVARHEGVLAAETLTVFQSMLQAHPDLNVVFCIADDGCLGAEKAFMQTHPSKDRMDKMFIAGWDGTLPVFQKILSGSVIRATGALDLVGIGAASARATIDAVEGKGSTQVNFPYVLVDADTPDLAKKFIAQAASVKA